MSEFKLKKDEEIPFRSVLIYGMGMMGASLALAMRASGLFNGKITGVVRSEKSAQFIEKHGMADRVIVAPELSVIKSQDLSEIDLIILGLPVKSTVELFDYIPSYKGLITDMSSTRREVHEAAARRTDLRFVGSHPMCGSEDAGPSAARADVYHNRLCLITEPGAKEGQDLSSDGKKIMAFWRSVGMKTYMMDPNVHDTVIAYLSHAPHLISGLIVNWASGSDPVEDSTKRSPIPITGGGFRDMVRIAGSNPEMWTDILETNRDHVVESLKDFSSKLDDLIAKAESGDREWWLEWFSSSRKMRNFLCGYPEDR